MRKRGPINCTLRLTNTKNRDTIPSITPKHEFLIKAVWRGTALILRIQARDEDEAVVKAGKKVLKMEGGASCLELIPIKQVR